MTDRYRVIVLREGETKDETLFELLGSATLLARLVPGALLDVLGADPDAQGAPDAESAAERQDAADEAAGRPKRTRRTKAQIAADNAAQALGFRDAAHQAEAAAPTDGTPAPVTVPAPAAPLPVAPTLPAADASPAPPYNPFN
jgi:hypothetical protein